MTTLQRTQPDPNCPLEIIAFIRTWNLPPSGMPNAHVFYQPDTSNSKGWTELTLAGRIKYNENQAECDRIAAEKFQPDIDAWAAQSVEMLLS